MAVTEAAIHAYLEGKVSTADRDGAGSGGGVSLGVTKLTELGGNVPNGKTRVGVEYGINVPTLTRCDGHKGLVTCLSPRSNVLSSLLECPTKLVRHLLVQTVQGIAVDVVSHLWLVDVASSSFLRVPKHLICHLHSHV